MKTSLLFLTAMLIVAASFSQCTPSAAKDSLNINNVNAGMLNGGDMWWDYSQSATGKYEVPKGSGKMSIYAGAIWMGGYDAGNNLHLAAQTYRNGGNDFWPGPLDTLSASIDSGSCAQYDHIWKINRFDVEMFKYEWALGNVQNGTYIPSSDFLSWPGNGDVSKGQAEYLAPFVDVNGNGIYDPLAGGDYPKIKGDQMLWWIMNDKGNVHTETGCLPMGIEIHASAYSFTCPSLPDSEQALNYTTLYHYEIFNRSSLAYDSTFFGLWQDPDLGCATDDYVGCNPAGNYAYVYNGDSVDVSCGGELGYGKNPPISSTVILNGPRLMTSFGYFINGAAYPQDDPAVGVCKEWYNYMTAHWEDGSPWIDSHSDTLHFMFPDFPYDTSGFSEAAAHNTPGDRRFLIGSGPFEFLPGEKIDYDFAVVFTRDTTLPWLSKAIFDKNEHDVQKIQQWFAADSFPSCLQLNLGVNEMNQNANGISIYPNPTSGMFEITSEKLEIKDVDIYNVMGEKVYSSAVNKKQETINLNEANGIYFLQIKTSEGIANRKIILFK